MNTEVKNTENTELLQQDYKHKITDAFAPLFLQLKGYNAVYETIINSDITEDIVAKARELRLKVVKSRTAATPIHKTGKQLILATGKMWDSQKKLLEQTAHEMESPLMDIEKHFENQEKQRLADLQASRYEQLKSYVDTEYNAPLSHYTDDEFNDLLCIKKKQYNDRIEAEKQAELKRLEEEKIKELHEQRVRVLIPFWDFVSDRTVNFGALNSAEWDKLIKEVTNLKTGYVAEQAKIKKEAERLKRELAAQAAKQKEKEEAERKKHEQEIAKQKAQAAKLAKQLKEKEEAELNEKQAQIEKERKEKEAARLKALAPEKEKINNWIDGFNLEDIDTSNMSDSGLQVIADIKTKFEGFKNWALTKEIK